MRSLCLCVALLPALAAAKPTAPALFCATYPAAPACVGQTPTCLTCHTAPPALNPYGAALQAVGLTDFEATLPTALRTVEGADSDGDGETNGAEVRAGTLPGDDASVVKPLPARGGLNPAFTPGTWDARFAFTRVKAAFCGRSPSFEERQALAAAPEPRAFVHQALEACLATPHWREEALPRLADSKIRPLGSAGTCLNFYGNFEPDYFLFVWALTEGRDARQLLRSQQHVRRNADGTLAPIDESQGPILAPTSRANVACRDRYGNVPSKVGGQPLSRNQRAGLLTTQWYLWRNTMGALMPRGTAALAASSWLGTELSVYEGLHPVAGEPRDLDRKGVNAAPCEQCHSTLDPLAYAFASYWGGTGGARPELTGIFQRDRHLYLSDLSDAGKQEWSTRPPRAHLFGQPLPLDSEVPQSSALVELARRMSDSEAFARTLVELAWVQAVGQKPDPQQQPEFDALWKGLPAAGFSFDRLLHALIDTDALGAP